MPCTVSPPPSYDEYADHANVDFLQQADDLSGQDLGVPRDMQVNPDHLIFPLCSSPLDPALPLTNHYKSRAKSIPVEGVGSKSTKPFIRT